MIRRQYIDIEGLKYYCNHGVLEQEKLVGNWFEVSLRLYYDASHAMRADNITAALNYAVIVEIVDKVMAIHSDLLEHIAGRIQEAVLEKFPKIEAGMIRVSKPHPPISTPMQNVSFTLEW